MTTTTTTPAPTAGQALDALTQLQAEGVSTEFVLGAVAALDPALILRTVASIRARRTARTGDSPVC